MGTHPERFARTSGRRGIGGKRQDLGNRYFRSSWEANWARYLNWMVARREIQSWVYEPDTFEFKDIKRGSRFYTPDFRITNFDGAIEYHEVKGWMDPRSATKLRRFAKRYPDIKLLLVDATFYKSVRDTLGRMIEGWEWGERNRVVGF